LKLLRPGDIVEVVGHKAQKPRGHFEGEGDEKEWVIDELFDPLLKVRVIYERKDI
jgi:hypothetical protein